MSRDQLLVPELIAWIEENIESSIKIEDVAVRSGYTRWHLQRLFRSVTGKQLGEYIRQRKPDLAT